MVCSIKSWQLLYGQKVEFVFSSTAQVYEELTKYAITTRGNGFILEGGKAGLHLEVKKDGVNHSQVCNDPLIQSLIKSN